MVIVALFTWARMLNRYLALGHFISNYRTNEQLFSSRDTFHIWRKHSIQQFLSLQSKPM